MPDVCNIRGRPIDLHVRGLEALGAQVDKVNLNLKPSSIQRDKFSWLWVFEVLYGVGAIWTVLSGLRQHAVVWEQLHESLDAFCRKECKKNLGFSCFSHSSSGCKPLASGCQTTARVVKVIGQAWCWS